MGTAINNAKLYVKKKKVWGKSKNTQGKNKSEGNLVLHVEVGDEPYKTRRPLNDIAVT